MYSLCALIGRTGDLERKLISHLGGRLVTLGEGLSMVPLSETLLRELQRKADGATDPTDVSGALEFLTPAVEHWARSLSHECVVAYVETEYFGGEGFERAVVWRDARLALGPLDGTGSINRALRALGVQGRNGQEEFEVVGLGRHRSLEEWLSEA